MPASAAAAVGPHSLAELRLEAAWQAGGERHRAIHHFSRFNVWRDLDLLPPVLQQEILGRGPGHRASHRFQAGELTGPWTAQAVRQHAASRFPHPTRQEQALEPALGRFYPAGLVTGGDGLAPLRLVAMDGDRHTFDGNHPLARHDLEVTVEVRAVLGAPAAAGGACTECLGELLAGPGMQCRHPGLATDFFSGAPFRRLDEEPDERFYGTPRLVQHLDGAALEELERCYRRLLAGRSRLLDLMASWDTHLPSDLAAARVTGLGLNAEELAANGRLDERWVQDLNRQPTLPFADGSFDAVVCTVSAEYLIRPLEVFAEVARVLVPGGLFVCSLSNRWFPGKAIALWRDLHEFERLGLVGEYLRRAGGFGALSTCSLRGLPRPATDRHAGATPWADPLYLIWASRVG